MPTFTTPDGSAIPLGDASTPSVKKQPVFDIQEDLDHDTLFKDQDFIKSARRYYWKRDKLSFGFGEAADQKVADYFISDQRWKDSNTVSSANRLAYITGAKGDNIVQQDREDLALMLDRWERLPNAFQRIFKGDIAGGVGAIGSNLARGAVDPSMYVGSIVGKLAAKKLIGEGVKAALKKQILQTGTALSTDAAITGGFDYLNQKIQVEAGIREDVNMWQVVTMGALGGVLSGAGAYFLAKPETKKGLKDFMWAAREAKGVAEKRKGQISTHPKDFLLPGSKAKMKDAIIESREAGDFKPTFKQIDPEDAYPIKQGKSFSADNVNEWRKVLTGAPPEMGVMTSMGVRLSDLDPTLGTVAPEITAKFLKDAGELEKKSLSGEFNMDNLPELFSEVKAISKDILEVMRRGTVSNSQLEANAVKKIESAGGDAISMVLGRKAGDAVIAEDSMIGKIAATALAQKAQKIRMSMATATGDELDSLASQFSEVSILAYRVAQGASVMGSEFGRGLHAQRSDVGPWESRAVDLVSEVEKYKERIFSKSGEKLTKEQQGAMDRELAQAIFTLDPNNPIEHELFLSNIANNDLRGMFWETWYNALLSGLPTMGINFVGNTLTLAIDNSERLLAGTAKAFTGDTALLREATWQIAGQMAAVGDAFKVAARTYMTELPFDPKTRLEGIDTASTRSIRLNPDRKGIMDMFQVVGKGGGGIGGRQLRFAGRVLMSMDDLFKVVHTRGYMYSQGAKEAIEKGVTSGKGIVDFITNDFMPRAVKDTGILKRAVEHSRRLTYTEDQGDVGKAISVIADGIPGGRLFLPFVRTPTNILRFAGERIPGVHFMTRTGADMKMGGDQKYLALSRLALGAVTMTVGAMLAFNDRVIGPAPTNPAERNAFDAAGLMPWSIRLGDQWVQWNRLDPIAIPFAMGAGIKSLVKAGLSDDDQQSVMEAFMVLISDAMLDKSWFQGVQNVVSAMDNPGRFGHSLGMSVSRTAVPSILAATTRAYNPVTTAPMTVLEAIYDRARFDRGEVPAKVNALGFESEYEVWGTGKGDRGVLSFINRMINPFKAKTITDDKLAKSLVELRYGMSRPSKKQFGVELSSEQYYIYSKAKGTHFYNTMKWMVESPGWDKMHKGQQRKLLDWANKKAGAVGQYALLAGYPEIFGAKFRDTKNFKNFSKATDSELEERLDDFIPKMLGRDEE